MKDLNATPETLKQFKENHEILTKFQEEDKKQP